MSSPGSHQKLSRNPSPMRGATSAPMQQQPPPPPRREWRENPVNKLTVGLLATYQRINEAYYENKRLQQLQLQQQQQQQLQQQQQQVEQNTSQRPREEQSFDYKFRTGEEIRSAQYCYRLGTLMGKGSFGQVVSATNLDHASNGFGTAVAIKIIKSKAPFTKQAKEEIRLLQVLNQHQGDRPHVVRLLDSFMHNNHQCLVFERLSTNLYELLKKTGFQGVSFELIRKFALQILSALQFLREEQVIHCDLKPENILLCHSQRSMLKIIDFGSSCKLEHKPYTYIQSRFYRAPEVILGVDYSCAIDMWSLGCILLEMHSGEPLFPGQNELEQMHLMVGAIGYPPAEMIQNGKKRSKFFTEAWELLDLKPANPALRLQTINQALGIAPSNGEGDAFALSASSGSGSKSASTTTSPYLRWQSKPDAFEGLAKYHEFANFLGAMLVYAPSQRILPQEALQHVFLQPIPKASAQHRPPTPQTMSSSSSPQNTASGGSRPGSQEKFATSSSPRRSSKRQLSE